MKRLCSNLFKIVFTFNFAFCVFSSHIIEKTETIVYNIGQGNFVQTNFYDKKGRKQILINDMGSGSSVGPAFYTPFAKVTPIKFKPSPSSSEQDIPTSTVKKSRFQEIVEDNKSNDKKWEKKLITVIRKSLCLNKTKRRRQRGEDYLDVETVIISHSDIDHYNWFSKIFSKPDDHIHNLILGGLPEHYDVSGILGWKSWLMTRFTKGTQVFYSALQFEKISSFEEYEKICEVKSGRTFAPSAFTTFNKEFYREENQNKFGEEFLKAVDFGDNIGIDFLSINSRHAPGLRNTIIRLAAPKDDNDDSLVVKISLYEKSIKALQPAQVLTLRKKSIFLPGDMTGITEERIKNNYLDYPTACESDIMLLAHHGADEKNCNSKELLRAINPSIIISSNDRAKFKHIHFNVYERLKELNLKWVPGHNVQVASQDNRTEDTQHYTSRAIFSTVDSGHVTVTFTLDGIKNGQGLNLYTEKEKDIDFIDNPIPNIMKSELSKLPEDKMVENELDFLEREEPIIPSLMELDSNNPFETPNKPRKLSLNSTKSISYTAKSLNFAEDKENVSPLTDSRNAVKKRKRAQTKVESEQKQQIKTKRMQPSRSAKHHKIRKLNISASQKTYY